MDVICERPRSCLLLPPSLSCSARALFYSFPSASASAAAFRGKQHFSARRTDGRTDRDDGARVVGVAVVARDIVRVVFRTQVRLSLSFLLPLPSHVLYDFAEVAAAAHSSVRREESAEEAAAVHSEEAVKMDMVPAAMARCWKRRAKEGK